MLKDKESIKMIVVLVAIAVITAALLAGVNMLTAPVIASNNQAELEDSLNKVLPAQEFKILRETDEYIVYEALENGERVGFCVVNSDKGYGGDVKVMTGVNLKGKVTNVKILEHSETPGLGANADKEDFTNQYVDKENGIEVVKNSVKGNQIRAISGATVTSSAVTRAVNFAITLAEEELK